MDKPAHPPNYIHAVDAQSYLYMDTPGAVTADVKMVCPIYPAS